MCSIIYAPYIGIVSVVQRCTICKGTNVLTNHIWLTIVMLELNPSYLFR